MFRGILGPIEFLERLRAGDQERFGKGLERRTMAITDGKKSGSTTPRIPPSKTELFGPMVEGFTVGEWCPTPDGSGPPQAVAIAFNVRELGDVVLRLKSKRAVDEMIASLAKSRDAVFGG